MPLVRYEHITFAPRVRGSEAALIHAIVAFPLLNIEIRILGSLFQTLVVTRYFSNLATDERRKLHFLFKLDSSCSEICGVGASWNYLEVFQVWGNSICPDFVPLDYVSSVFGVATH